MSGTQGFTVVTKGAAAIWQAHPKDVTFTFQSTLEYSLASTATIDAWLGLSDATKFKVKLISDVAATKINGNIYLGVSQTV